MPVEPSLTTMQGCINIQHVWLQTCQYCLWISDQGDYEVPPSNTINSDDPHVYSELKIVDANTDTEAPSRDVYANVSR